MFERIKINNPPVVKKIRKKKGINIGSLIIEISNNVFGSKVFISNARPTKDSTEITMWGMNFFRFCMV